MILYVLLAALILPVIVLASLSALARRPTNLGIVNGKLADCPGTPNCVCSFGEDAEHRIEPLRFTGPPDVAFAKLRALVERQPRVAIVSGDERYLHAEFTSALFRFVDDVEFLLDAEAGVIHVRSASRVGRSDLGANRRRIEAIRQQFQES